MNTKGAFRRTRNPANWTLMIIPVLSPRMTMKGVVVAAFTIVCSVHG